MRAEFNGAKEMAELVESVADRLDDIVVPMRDIADLFAREMTENLTMRRVNADGSSWAPLTDSTKKRHDSIFGIDANSQNSPQTAESIRVFVRERIAGAEATGKGGIFMHRGRSRDWRRGYDSPTTRTGYGKLKDGTKIRTEAGSRRRGALRKKARGAFGPEIQGVEMPKREFGYVREQTQEEAVRIVLDHLFVKFSE